jgi:hypothetical protein
MPPRKQYNEYVMKKALKYLLPDELGILNRLNTPHKLQDFLNEFPQNFEHDGETCMSPRRVMREGRAHCLEGAIFASTVLWYHGNRPLVMHLLTKDHDYDHVVAVFRENGLWGAISKTNHAVLRYRDPVYKNPRELAMSYFNEYFLDRTGEKTMLGYTKPVDLGKVFGSDWITSENDLWHINDKLFHSPHKPIAPKHAMKRLRPADPIEIRVMDVPEQIPKA